MRRHGKKHAAVVLMAVACSAWWCCYRFSTM